jgi:hypothetical protein
MQAEKHIVAVTVVLRGIVVCITSVISLTQRDSTAPDVDEGAVEAVNDVGTEIPRYCPTSETVDPLLLDARCCFSTRWFPDLSLILEEVCSE